MARDPAQRLINWFAWLMLAVVFAALVLFVAAAFALRWLMQHWIGG